MKLQFSISDRPIFDVKAWLETIEPKFMSKNKSIVGERLFDAYENVMFDFKPLLEATKKDGIVDKEGRVLTNNDVFNAINFYILLVKKLVHILEFKVYITRNVHKETGVGYVVVRANWLDDNGKLFRYFSQNLGAEHKISVNGKIPERLIESSKEYIKEVMIDQFYIDYGWDDITGIDQYGNRVLVDD